MAHTKQGRELTETHRRTQAGVSLSLVDIIRDLFLSMMDPADIDQSSARFIRKALPVILESRRLSSDVATKYLEQFRQVELEGLVDSAELAGDPADEHTVSQETLRLWTVNPEEYTDVDLDSDLSEIESPTDIARQLHSSGAARAKNRIGKGADPAEALDTSASAVAATSQRLVAEGGRRPIAREVSQGRNGAVGYARVMDGDPCPFCAMLASRGAVYRSDAFTGSTSLFSGDGKFKVHDGCGCTMEPVYGRRVTDLPPGSAELAQEWARVASGQSDPFAYWRRWRESGTKPGEERAGAAGTDGRGNASAPQYGRKRSKSKGRKQVSELDPEELQRTLRGMYIRRAGLEEELAGLENRGQSVTEPGPARAIQSQLKRLEKNISHAKRRIGKM